MAGRIGVAKHALKRCYGCGVNRRLPLPEKLCRACRTKVDSHSTLTMPVSEVTCSVDNRDSRASGENMRHCAHLDGEHYDALYDEWTSRYHCCVCGYLWEEPGKFWGGRWIKKQHMTAGNFETWRPLSEEGRRILKQAGFDVG